MVSLVQWRALIGTFNCRISATSTNNRYNLIRSFGYKLENLLLFYHYLQGVYFTMITFFVYLCSFTLPWGYRTKPRSKETRRELPFCLSLEC